MGKSHSHKIKGRQNRPCSGNKSMFQIGAKDIIIRNHAKLRCLQRVPQYILPSYTEQEIRKLAVRARQKGVSVLTLPRYFDDTNKLMELDITRAQAEQIYSKYVNKIEERHSSKYYFYRYFIFCFAGNNSKCLLSVIPALPKAEMDIVLDPNHIKLKDYSDHFFDEE